MPPPRYISQADKAVEPPDPLDLDATSTPTLKDMRHNQPAEYGISQLARDSGISTRTLRHYDAIGLLSPSFTATNGYRFYGQPEVLRLQRIPWQRRG